MSANLHDLLISRFPANRAAPCFILADGSEISYGELEASAARVAARLIAEGVQPGDRVALQAEKSPEVIMVYLGGIGSIAGSIIGATVYTVLLEVLRPLGIWRMVFIPLVLVLLMLFRPKGMMGLREFRWFVPLRDRLALRPGKERGGSA